VQNGGLAGKFLFADEGKKYFRRYIYTRPRRPTPPPSPSRSLSLSLFLPLRGMRATREIHPRLPFTRFPVFCIFLPRAGVSLRLEFRIGENRFIRPPSGPSSGIYAEMEIARYSIAQNVPGYVPGSFRDNSVTLSRNRIDRESMRVALWLAVCRGKSRTGIQDGVC